MNDDNEEDDDEQFNEGELNTLTQRFDVIARFCNINIDTAFSRVNEGLTFLMAKYEEELKANNEEVQTVIEKRFAWTIRVITALMNLGKLSAKLLSENGSHCKLTLNGSLFWLGKPKV